LEFLIDYGMFLAKAITIVLSIGVVAGLIASAGQKNKKGEKKGKIRVTQINEHIDGLRDTLRASILDKEQLKEIEKTEKKKIKAENKRKKKATAKNTEGADNDDSATKRYFVVNFEGNIAADAVESLREEITAILSMATKNDEVILRLESPGGMVHAYGLASSQLLRIKNKNIPLTICVDKVAASGGYMMACLADRLVAAPFAIIGSIGVLVQLPNFYRVLKKYDVDYEIISAGEYKRTLTHFGEITNKGKDKVKEDVENIHQIFKDWVKTYRPSVEIDTIATGETWVGSQAKERYMVDDIKTSDECVIEACETYEVYEIKFEIKKPLQVRLANLLEESANRLISRGFGKSDHDIYQ
jgi:serine protease SohB